MIIYFEKSVKPYKGFTATWQTIEGCTHAEAKEIINEFKKIPIITNVQYIKRKYRTWNNIAVSFKSEEDEAAFLLLSNGGIKIF